MKDFMGGFLLADDSAVRQCLLKFSDAGRRDASSVDIQDLEFDKGGEMHQARIGHVSITESHRVKAF